MAEDRIMKLLTRR